MSKTNCDCNPPAIVSSVAGERCHITDDRGTWCAIENENGIYLQNLLIRSTEEILRDEKFRTRVAAELAEHEEKITRQQELKTKLKNGESLSIQELGELLKALL